MSDVAWLLERCADGAVDPDHKARAVAALAEWDRVAEENQRLRGALTVIGEAVTVATRLAS